MSIYSLFKRALVGLPCDPDTLPNGSPRPSQGDGLWVGDGNEILQNERYVNENIGEMGKGNFGGYKKLFPKTKDVQIRNVDELKSKKFIVELEEIESPKARLVKKMIKDMVSDVH